MTTHNKSNLIFPAGRTKLLTSYDPEEMGEQHDYWDVEHHQLGRGRFFGQISSIYTHRMQISWTRREPGIWIKGGIPKGTVILTAVVRSKGPVVSRGELLEPNEVYVLKEGEELDFRTSAPSELFTIAVEENMLRDHMAAFYGMSLEQFRTRQRVLLEKTIVPMVRKRSKNLLVHAIRNRAVFQNEETGIPLETQILSAFLGHLQQPTNCLDIPHRRRMAKNAETLMRSLLQETVSITDICRQLKVAERTLHQGFKELFGLSPKAYLQQMRLGSARQDLLAASRAENISDIAMKWGFYHLSRFTQQYKRMFGELPSCTFGRRRRELAAA